MPSLAKSIVFSVGAALLLSTQMAGASDTIVHVAQAASPSNFKTPQQTYLATQSSFDKFVPRPSFDKAKTRIDYSTFDSALDIAVLYTGSSTRRRAKRKPAPLGSRLRTTLGHTSPYQLEGNKVVFSTLDDNFITSLSAYQDELERLGNEVDISALPRNEQLAYWLNLHNLTVMDIIARNYPVRRPSKILIGTDKTPMHEARLITLKGQSLSLRDIREKIVFSNWKNPDVIYGFWHGDIGSPSLQKSAFTGQNTKSLLDFSASEFTNSLRAINKSKDKVMVSELYYDVAPYYFPNFGPDLTAHLRPHLRDDVRGLLASYSAIKPDDYETDIADMTGGTGNRLLSSSAAVNRGLGLLDQVCPECPRDTKGTLNSNLVRQSFVEKLRDKRVTLSRQGRRWSSTVTIQDIKTEDRQVEEVE